jgi:hypothetical protein
MGLEILMVVTMQIRRRPCVFCIVWQINSDVLAKPAGFIFRSSRVVHEYTVIGEALLSSSPGSTIWMYRQQVPSKRQYLSAMLHDVTSQKTVIFLLRA